MTTTGERGIVCWMQIETESLTYLKQLPSEKADAIRKVLEPLIEEPPKPQFFLRWNDEKSLWQSKIQLKDDTV
jgi:hypothetical protein